MLRHPTGARLVAITKTELAEVARPDGVGVLARAAATSRMGPHATSVLYAVPLGRGGLHGVESRRLRAAATDRPELNGAAVEKPTAESASLRPVIASREDLQRGRRGQVRLVTDRGLLLAHR